MKLYGILLLAALCFPALTGTAQGTTASDVPAGIQSGDTRRQKPAAQVVVDSIQWRHDLTRVYCRIQGMPHTSDRIDAVTLNVPKRQFKATDIDGVDFKRYFQWEDEPYINLEIDFPAIGKPHAPCSLNFTTVHGEIKASFDK